MQLTGRCHALFAFDVGRELDLASATKRLTADTEVRPFRRKHAPRPAELRSAPLRFSRSEASRALGAFATEEVVELALYPFGAICVTWSVPFRSELEELIDLSSSLYDHRDLTQASRELVEDVVAAVGDALKGPGAAGMVEDYVVFHVTAVDGGVAALESRASDVARLLRAERGELSDGEIQNALGGTLAFSRDEACTIDWLGALLVGAEMEDERLVLEFTTVELLELRFLDAQIARDIDHAYASFAGGRPGLRGFRVPNAEVSRIALRQIDSAALHEGFDNALRLVGDDYLARFYRTAADRFHFSEWDAAIDRKLDVLGAIYGRLSDQAARVRAEILEWIIIVLIAVDILLYFTPWRG